MGGQKVACLATLNHPESRGETGDRFISNMVLSLVTRELKGCENARSEMRPIALRIVYRDDQWISLRNRVQVKILRFRSEVRRLLGSTSVNVQIHIVGRPGLDPGTLGSKGTFQWLFCVSLVAHVHCFQGIVLS
jgi:hypothetical protein